MESKFHGLFRKNFVVEIAASYLSMLGGIEVDLDIDVGEEFRGPLADNQYLLSEGATIRELTANIVDHR